jgi:uncharacterized Tic20 family protein
MNSSPNTEERLWAVMSHLSVLAFGLGIALPIAGWSDQRRKSSYAAYQCLQALGYQSLIYTIWLLSYIVVFILFLIVLILATGMAADRVNVSAWTTILLVLSTGLFILYLLFPIIAAVACAFGKDYRYPILGKRLAKHLEYGEPNETQTFASLNKEHEEQWVAAMGHFSVIIFFWGMFAPVTCWIMQGRNSAFLRFQSIQTTIYQGAVNIFFVIMGVIFWIGSVPLLVFGGQIGQSSLSSEAAMTALAFIIVFMLAALVMLLALPLFHILGQVAGYRVLKGKNYHYPLLGKLLEKRLAKSHGVQELAPGSSSELPDTTKETS